MLLLQKCARNQYQFKRLENMGSFNRWNSTQIILWRPLWRFADTYLVLMNLITSTILHYCFCLKQSLAFIMETNSESGKSLSFLEPHLSQNKNRWWFSSASNVPVSLKLRQILRNSNDCSRASLWAKRSSAGRYGIIYLKIRLCVLSNSFQPRILRCVHVCLEGT